MIGFLRKFVEMHLNVSLGILVVLPWLRTQKTASAQLSFVLIIYLEKMLFLVSEALVVPKIWSPCPDGPLPINPPTLR